MKSRNLLVVSALVCGLAAMASASSVSVTFDQATAEPGDTVTLTVAGVSDAAVDTVALDLTFTTPLAATVPGPGGGTWNGSTGWGAPWTTAPFVDMAEISSAAGQLVIGGSAFDLLGGTFSSGTIATISITIPDDGSYGFGDTVNAVPSYAEYGNSGDVVGDNDRSGGTLTIVPEPATMSLLGFGIAGVLLRRKRR